MKRTSAFFSVLLIAGAGAAASEPATAETARQTIAEWVQTQRLLSEEKAAWQQEEELLRQSIGLLEQEVELLRTQSAALETASGDAAEAVRSLTGQNETFRAADAGAGAFLAELELEVDRLRPALPPPLLADLAPLFSRLDEARSRPTPLSQRLQTLLGILGEVNRFQRTVTFARETRELEDGTRREVRTLYLGLAQAFFVDDHSRIAGTGHPTLSGWTWKRNDTLAAEVAKAIAVYQKQRPPEFIPLPLEVAP